MQENQISHVFWTFPPLTEEDMASCSRTFRKHKNAGEVRKLIENANPKVNTCSDKVIFENFSGMAEW